MNEIEEYLPCVNCILLAICKAEYAATVRDMDNPMCNFITDRYCKCDIMHIKFSHSTRKLTSYMTLFRRFFKGET